MTPIILIILGVSGVYCDSHSLQYYKTGVSSPGSGLPVFSAVGYVDDREIMNYNSDTRQCLPKVEWMKKLGDDYWEGQTQRARANEAVSKHNVQTVMGRFNQTGGLHIVQWMQGCELRDDGSTAGYYQAGYDGRDLLYLDTQSWMWIPTMNEAQISTQRWNSPEERRGEIQKNYLENFCIDWLKTHIKNGREDLERRDLIQDLTGTKVGGDPLACLLHLVPIPKKKYRRSLVAHMLAAAKLTIAAKWKCESPPTLKEWINRMNEIQRMEDLTESHGGRGEEFGKTWYPWMKFRDSTEFLDWIGQP